MPSVTGTASDAVETPNSGDLMSLKPEQKPLSSQTDAMQEPSSSSSRPIPIDGFEEDAALSKSEYLTRAEVLNRRLRRVKQLSRIYRDQYWALMEELKVKYREYYWDYGKSPYLVDEEQERENSHYGGGKENPGNGNCGNGAPAGRCGIHGCKAKAIALTRFCHIHILSQSGQKFYKPCSFSVKSTNTGPIPCGKPILKSAVPAYCAQHFQHAEKHTVRALKKAGLNISSTNNFAPKFHVIVAEYVHQIQHKRRAAQRANQENVEGEDKSS